MKPSPFDSPVSRREVLRRSAVGFGAIGLAGTLQAAGLLGSAQAAGISRGHFAPRAKRVIYLFMNGGPSHVDTFDPKPALKEHEGEIPGGDNGRKKKGGFIPSPFAFAPQGQSGVVMSELFPNIARCADDLCVIRSMHTDVPNHEPGLLIMNCGNQQPIRPSLGSWISYGLGSENENLPAFVVLATRKPVVGPALWSNSFLPAAYQGMSVDTSEMEISKLVTNLHHPTLGRIEQRQQLDLLAQLNQLHLQQRRDSALEAQIQAMETAFQMQAEAAEAFDISREPEALREAYGKTNFGQSCLLARRLCEHGVRLVQVFYLSKDNNQPWDTHSNNDDGHRKLCKDADQATAALLTDLKQRGLLEDTLVIWGGEFGRTPYAEKQEKAKPGRDHHHTGFSMFLAGGGVKGGLTYGSTDEFGMHAVENRVHVHDLHATILHLLGLDHERLTYHYSGRDFRLTDVHGRVVRDILA
ncbi:MAG TPA: DUF1501 domain-containing protein [Pirellulaceae bacterium]|nr:DUF1501 domain-containing protein [Pirellulaceae bacterium]